VRTDELDFELPEDRIATRPASPRDSSRLLVLSRSDPDVVSDRVFTDLPDLLDPGDLLVFNRSGVLRARLRGRMAATGGGVDMLYLHTRRDDPHAWTLLVNAKRPREGREIELVDADDRPTGDRLTLVERDETEGGGAWIARVDPQGGGDPMGVLDRAGRVPLPPYIRAQRRIRGEPVESERDEQDYQTRYASRADAGSVAAPTAGLHFTDRVLDALDRRGVQRADVMLHVGVGTFKPIESDTVEGHDMHREWCSLGDARPRFERGAPASGRVIGVGSTSVRTLEAFALERERTGALPASLETDILIAPGHPWRWVGGMVTNFHLPRSTLIAMVAAALETPNGPSGARRVRAAYEHAVREGYRFYSYGDAMLILP